MEFQATNAYFILGRTRAANRTKKPSAVKNEEIS
jgi:hypothetical protein